MTARESCSGGLSKLHSIGHHSITSVQILFCSILLTVPYRLTFDVVRNDNVQITLMHAQKMCKISTFESSICAVSFTGYFFCEIYHNTMQLSESFGNGNIAAVVR